MQDGRGEDHGVPGKIGITVPMSPIAISTSVRSTRKAPSLLL